MAKATRYLKKGCQSYWAYILDAKKEKPGITHIPVVREFEDVFHDDLTSLPPDKQVEFRIDLTPGVAPIACVHYPRVVEGDERKILFLSHVRERIDLILIISILKV